MKFIIKNPKQNFVMLARRIGYMPMPSTEQEFNCVRPVAGNRYPRFHLFITENKQANELIFNLHLDQKKQSYQGSSAHSGEYNGQVIEIEMQRIKEVIKKLVA
ncbi:MAG: hypothetical protein ISS87_00330 [Candidatus Pacebacteria bacterium]|nr:hypothetical protein [Candidatus Paceibacterota bacterium]